MRLVNLSQTCWNTLLENPGAKQQIYFSLDLTIPQKRPYFGAYAKNRKKQHGEKIGFLDYPFMAINPFFKNNFHDKNH